jgi:aminotransferase EvaB
MLLLNNIGLRIHQNRSQIFNAMERVLSRGSLVLGPEVDSLEKSFAAYLGAKYCVGVANGTDAIELGLKALGIVRGDRVATVANAGMYTTTTLLSIGAEPYFMDVNPLSSVTLSEVIRAIDDGVKAIVVTHLYGMAVPEIREIATLCKNRNVLLLEDCAQAHGARIDGQTVGTYGDAASFSFYPTKNLGALGDGGAVVTNCLEVSEKLKQLRQYGWSSKYKVELAGARNSRLDEMQAAIIATFLPQLDASNARRRAIAENYSRYIQHPDLETPPVGGEEYVAHLYVIRSTSRDALREHLLACDIGSDIHYPIPDYRQPVFGGQYSSLYLPNTERLARETLTLPLYPEMLDSEVDRVISMVNAW